MLSNRESGYGRYDVCVIPNNPQQLGVVMEFKTSSRTSLQATAQEALQQIVDKDYAAMLRSRGITHILGLGLAFYKKQVVITDRYL